MASPKSSPENHNYPFATSPDILRTHQKDAYVTGSLTSQLNTILRELFGARFAHKYNNTTTHLSELLYLCVTTLLGNRTLGEEYCDIIQIEDDSLRLAGLAKRVGYIVSVVFSPWLLSKMLPALRRRLRIKLERNLERAQQRKQNLQSRSLRIQEYFLRHLDTFTSLSPIYAVSLAAFYFTGSYYHISKRITGLRYIFTKQIKPNEQRIGYEVLGVLLMLQMAVQTTLHIRESFYDTNVEGSIDRTDVAVPDQRTAMVGPGIEIPIGGHQDSAFDEASDSLLADLEVPHRLPPGIAQHTSTPILNEPRYDIKDDKLMTWIPDGQQRKCTLCLDPFRDPSVTTCGHVFCWTCVQDWVKEKAECPLCRQSVLPQKILPLRSL